MHNKALSTFNMKPAVRDRVNTEKTDTNKITWCDFFLARMTSLSETGFYLLITNSFCHILFTSDWFYKSIKSSIV